MTNAYDLFHESCFMSCFVEACFRVISRFSMFIFDPFVRIIKKKKNAISESYYSHSETRCCLGSQLFSVFLFVSTVRI